MMQPKEWVDSTLDEFGNPPHIVAEMLDSLNDCHPESIFKRSCGPTWIDEARSHLASRSGGLQ